MKTVHEKGQQFSCERCGKKFKHEYSQKRHIAKCKDLEENDEQKKFLQCLCFAETKISFHYYVSINQVVQSEQVWQFDEGGQETAKEP